MSDLYLLDTEGSGSRISKSASKALKVRSVSMRYETLKPK